MISVHSQVLRIYSDFLQQNMVVTFFLKGEFMFMTIFLVKVTIVQDIVCVFYQVHRQGQGRNEQEMASSIF